MTPPAPVARPEVVTEAVPSSRPAWVERATDPDHKSVGLMYIGAALCFLAVAAIELVLIRVQLIVPENTAIGNVTFDRILSVFGVTALVFFAIPLLLGLISYVTPLQIGARGVAFPRLGLFSFWLYALGAATVYGSFMWRPAETGLAALPTLSDTTFSPTAGADAWIVGAGLALIGFVCFAVNLLTTLHNMRAPGMAWRRLPPFSWAATVGGYLLLIVGSVMVAALVMLFIDRNFSGVFFVPGEGGAPLLYQHLAWIFLTGAFFFVVVMASGVISDVLPVFAGKPLFTQRGAMLCMLAIGVLGPLTWMVNMYTAPIPLGFEIFSMLFATALLVPAGLLAYNWVATLWGGTLHLRAAPLYALGAISAITLGLAGRLAYALIPVGWQLNNTTAAQGDTVCVIVGGAVLGGFAALHYWFPKLSGRMMGEGLGKAAFAAILVGLYVFELGSFFAGVKGQPVDVYKFFQGNGLDGYNLIASIGAILLSVGILVELTNSAWSWSRGVRAGHDPWGGATLEWFALSPPPVHNFDAVPDVRSAEPLADIRRAIAERTESWTPPPAPEPAAEPEPEPEPTSADG